ncbi:hypothetical protein [Mariniblastus fucicola]|uniref:Uncharacterized protein n=1 Tax=Mariniblastus fucicola TaxID=980251 RepID=A0A5B9P6V2_9BACT|nr:hypothetical protein [Mariniblastus fucicola]QEG22014.1 hypothetical protein MFFC18_18750 [Mariniblastus fucicola]
MVDKNLTDAFVQSWIVMTDFFNDLVTNYSGWDQVRPMLKLIELFEENQLNKEFRAGQSLHSLCISRSAKHGLEMDYPSIAFCSLGNDKFEMIFFDGKTHHPKRQLVLSEIDIENDVYIAQLLSVPIHGK